MERRSLYGMHVWTGMDIESNLNLPPPILRFSFSVYFHHTDSHTLYPNLTDPTFHNPQEMKGDRVASCQEAQTAPATCIHSLFSSDDAEVSKLCGPRSAHVIEA